MAGSDFHRTILVIGFFLLPVTIPHAYTVPGERVLIRKTTSPDDRRLYDLTLMCAVPDNARAALE